MKTVDPVKQRKVISLVGKAVRWTLSDGKGNKSTYLHQFESDGSIVFWGEDGVGRGTRVRASRALVKKVSDRIFVVSYLNPPYTLTVILSTENMKAIGFASSEKFWMNFTGTWEEVALRRDSR